MQKTSEVRELTWDEFVAAFRPVRNHLDSKANLDGSMFETCGAEFEYVRKCAEADPRMVWTFRHDGKGGTMISEGLLVVGEELLHGDRLGYLVTAVPAPEGVSFVVNHQSAVSEVGVTLEDAKGVKGSFTLSVFANGSVYHGDGVVWGDDDEGYQPEHTVNATFDVLDGSGKNRTISGDVWRTIENSGLLDEFVARFAMPGDLNEYWLEEVEAAAETEDSLDPKFVMSSAIRAYYQDSGCGKNDLDESVELLMKECRDLFEDEDAAFAFLVDVPAELRLSERG